MRGNSSLNGDRAIFELPSNSVPIVVGALIYTDYFIALI